MFAIMSAEATKQAKEIEAAHEAYEKVQEENRLVLREQDLFPP